MKKAEEWWEWFKQSDEHPEITHVKQMIKKVQEEAFNEGITEAIELMDANEDGLQNSDDVGLWNFVRRKLISKL